MSSESKTLKEDKMKEASTMEKVSCVHATCPNVEIKQNNSAKISMISNVCAVAEHNKCESKAVVANNASAENNFSTLIRLLTENAATVENEACTTNVAQCALPKPKPTTISDIIKSMNLECEIKVYRSDAVPAKQEQQAQAQLNKTALCNVCLNDYSTAEDTIAEQDIALSLHSIYRNYWDKAFPPLKKGEQYYKRTPKLTKAERAKAAKAAKAARDQTHSTNAFDDVEMFDKSNFKKYLDKIEKKRIMAKCRWQKNFGAPKTKSFKKPKINNNIQNNNNNVVNTTNNTNQTTPAKKTVSFKQQQASSTNKSERYFCDECIALNNISTAIQTHMTKDMLFDSYQFIKECWNKEHGIPLRRNKSKRTRKTYLKYAQNANKRNQYTKLAFGKKRGFKNTNLKRKKVKATFPTTRKYVPKRKLPATQKKCRLGLLKALWKAKFNKHQCRPCAIKRVRFLPQKQIMTPCTIYRHNKNRLLRIPQTQPRVMSYVEFINALKQRRVALSKRTKCSHYSKPALAKRSYANQPCFNPFLTPRDLRSSYAACNCRRSGVSKRSQRLF